MEIKHSTEILSGIAAETKELQFETLQRCQISHANTILRHLSEIKKAL